MRDSIMGCGSTHRSESLAKASVEAYAQVCQRLLTRLPGHSRPGAGTQASPARAKRRVDDSRDFRRDKAREHGQILRFRKVSSIPGAADSGANLSASDLFAILWRALADILGTAAAATLLRRAAQRAVPRCPELAALSITRESLEYGYTVPTAWNDPATEPPQALCELARELWTLLVDLTGSVVVNRLEQIPELRGRGIVPQREEQS
jgi:hypothetical protein